MLISAKIDEKPYGHHDHITIIVIVHACLHKYIAQQQNQLMHANLKSSYLKVLQ